MTETNRRLAAQFRAIAGMLAARGANPHRVRAYRRAADTLDRLTEDVSAHAANGSLREIPGIGRDLSAKILEFLATGIVPPVEECREPLPEAVQDWTTLPGLSETTVRYLYTGLGIRTLEDLEALVRSHLLRTMPGATISEEALLDAIESRRRPAGSP